MTKADGKTWHLRNWNQQMFDDMARNKSEMIIELQQ